MQNLDNKSSLTLKLYKIEGEATPNASTPTQIRRQESTKAKSSKDLSKLMLSKNHERKTTREEPKVLLPPASSPILRKASTSIHDNISSSVSEKPKAVVFNVSRRKSSSASEVQSPIDVEKFLAAEKKKYLVYLDEPKVLILGSADSGKSTVLKQLKIIYNGGFSQREKDETRSNLMMNLLSVAMALCLKTSSLLPVEEILNSSIRSNAYNRSDLSTDDASFIMMHSLFDFYDAWLMTRALPLPVKITTIIQDLWNNEDNRSRYNSELIIHFPESTNYFLKNLQMYLNPNYEISYQDILMLRVATTAVSETNFTVDRRVYHIFDVGGQKRLRKAWVPYFDQVDCIMFVTSLSCFDQSLAEDSTINQMLDSLVLFEELCNHPLLCKLDFILFLNKRDLFKVKVKSGTAHLSKWFPRYKGSSTDVEKGMKFIKHMFVEKKKIGAPPVVHLTHATDTETIKDVVKTVLTWIVSKKLQSYGVL